MKLSALRSAMNSSLSFIIYKILLFQEAVINELKSKTKQVKETRLLKQDEVYNGALEDILLGKLPL